MGTLLRIISDIHGDYDYYIKLCNDLEYGNYSLQLGDMGFNYDKITNSLDPTYHRFVGGNHDNFDLYYDCPNALGNFGNVSLGPFNFFYLRGAFSVDKNPRVISQNLTGIKSWWEEEQLSYRESMCALDEYEHTKPQVVFTHDITSDVSNFVGNETILRMFGHEPDMVTLTQDLLNQMHYYHSPKLWFFAHYHKNFDLVYRGTRFICRQEKGYIDVDENWEVVRTN